MTARSHATAIRMVAVASLIGTTIEWYDFFLYGTAAATVFNRLYFPTFDPISGTLASFATYTVGFVARPIGGIVIGHYGDRIGRKSMLVLTLTIMGVATFAIGLLPTYATAGPWAAVALVALRVAQGFGVGGEWGGAVLMAVEHAPSGARGFYGSWPQIGVPAGLLVSTAVFAQFARLPEDQFLSWGWRVPFLLSIVLVAIGLVIRLRILETPAFERIKEEQAESRQPALEVLTTQPREVLLAIGARLAENGAFYIYTVFLLVYGTQKAGLDRQAVLNGILLAAACAMVAIPICGALSDRFGRRPVYLFGACATAVWAYPLFRLFDTGSTALAALALVVALVFAHSPMYGPQAAFLSELFRTRVRYSGASLGSQLASVVSGGLSPFIATALLPYGRGALASYVIAMAIVTIASVLAASETRDRDIAAHH
ncbi:MAG TPA: MFS transporter [Vicinamibacterales bacterium]|nr:MFS transporter [Vicinamibacterales bacterium]